MFGLLWRGAPGCVRGGRARGRVMRALVLRHPAGQEYSPTGFGIILGMLLKAKATLERRKSKMCLACSFRYFVTSNVCGPLDKLCMYDRRRSFNRYASTLSLACR